MKKSKSNAFVKRPPAPGSSDFHAFSLPMVFAILWLVIVGGYYYSNYWPDYSRLSMMLDQVDLPTWSAFLTDFTNLVLAALGAALAILTGRWVLRLFGMLPGSRLESLLASSGLGAGLLSSVLLMLGFFGLWYKGVFVGLGLAAMGAGLVWNRDLFDRSGKSAVRQETPPWRFLDKAMLGVIGLYLFVCLVEALAPEIFYDSLVYHLAIPRLWSLHHRIFPTPMNFFSGIPFNMEVLFGYALAISGAPLAKLVHFMAGLGVLGAIYMLARRYSSSRAGLIGCLLFVAAPMTAMEFEKTAVELGSTFFGLMALWALLASEEYPPERRRRWLVLAGFLAGWTMGTKYTAWIILPSLCVTHGFLWLSRPTRTIKNFWAEQGLLICSAGLVIAPWVIKNFCFYKNPLYPFLNSVFPNPDNALFNWAGVQGDAGSRDILKELSSWKGIRDYCLEPWNVSIHGQSDANYLGPLYLLVLPWLAFLSKRPPVRALGVAFLGQWFLYSLSSHLARFWIPALAILAVLLGICIEDAHAKRRFKAGIVSALVAGSLVNLYWFSLMTYMFAGWQVVLGRTTASDYLNEAHSSYPSPYYGAAEFINKRTPASAQVMVLGDARGFFVERPFIAATVFDTHPVIRLSERAPDGDALYEEMRRQGITHILLNVAEAARLRTYPRSPWTAAGQTAFDRFWQRHAHAVFQDHSPQPPYARYTIVYELVPDRRRLEPGVDQTPDFYLQMYQTPHP